MNLMLYKSGFFQSRVFIFFVISLMTVFSCKSEGGDYAGNSVIHPIKENIPHYDQEHISIDTVRTFKNMQEKPERLELFHQYLRNSDRIITEKLNIEVGSPYPGFNVVSIDDGRLMVLDITNDRLLEYDLNDHNFLMLAERGRGPGDIMYSEEMVKHMNSIYIASGNMRISRFDCKTTPCEFDEVIPLKFSPSSIALAGDTLAVLGSVDVRAASGNKHEDGLKDLKAIHLLNGTGDNMSVFGETYNTDGHWMLLRPFVFDGMIRYSPAEDLFILSFMMFPYLYIYDARDQSLKTTYEISDFLLGKQRYWPDIGRLEVPMENYSIIRSTKIIENNLLWLEIETRKKRRIPNSHWDLLFTYYVVDLKNREAYYMGNVEAEGNGSSEQFFFIENGLIIHRGGSLFWAKDNL